ncbi:asparagine synthase (glutamine-hydrolyzing) [Hanstruepera ponticola]|uniref:asparagine synthase (glutamine-hydrolyzing) n=1 Tax=Hanstruepera ponticola TaxID=2042995 RepID=UPI00177FCB4F|nr:asparagine synthase (glutamine-hydrolyzing) [Hanstruepera ponticola]
MCGIYGITYNRYNADQISEKLKRINFRGPDLSAQKPFENRVVLAHNRLSIIDLDPRSNQPFSYENKVHIVFNGEIYNFKDIKSELVKKGYNFRTESDTEVICAAYLEYGTELPNMLNGMFAFVIYDEINNKLFGARDRLGQKPFYYLLNNDGFEFASQLSAIQLHNKNLSISSKSITQYFAWGVVPDPYTIFNEVNKLPAGHRFTYHISSKKFSISKYWDIDNANTKPFTGSFNEAKSKLSHLIKDAVKIRLYADVPVGVFLSGGVDSSLVSAMAQNVTNSQVKTFSVKFNEKGFDESIYAQKVANHLKTDHHIISCNYNEGLDLIDSFNHYYDEPFADSSAIPSMLLSKHTRKKVTVALSGDGGDEMFIGYQRYHWMKQVSTLYKTPKQFRDFTAFLLNAAPNYKLKTISKGLRFNNLNSLYLASVTGIDASWIQSDFDYLDIEEKAYLENSKKNIYERMSDFDIKAYLNWDINTKVDRATMAYSLEARSPLMDYRVVNFAQSLPTQFKYKNSNQKIILKNILYDYVPKSYFNRPKSGFTMPFSDWFRNELKDMVLSELNDEGLRQIPNIDIDEVKLRINQHMDGSWNRYPLIWKLLVLKQWMNNNGKGYPIV